MAGRQGPRPEQLQGPDTVTGAWMPNGWGTARTSVLRWRSRLCSACRSGRLRGGLERIERWRLPALTEAGVERAFARPRQCGARPRADLQRGFRMRERVCRRRRGDCWRCSRGRSRGHHPGRCLLVARRHAASDLLIAGRRATPGRGQRRRGHGRRQGNHVVRRIRGLRRLWGGSGCGQPCGGGEHLLGGRGRGHLRQPFAGHEQGDRGDRCRQRSTAPQRQRAAGRAAGAAAGAGSSATAARTLAAKSSGAGALATPRSTSPQSCQRSWQPANSSSWARRRSKSATPRHSARHPPAQTAAGDNDVRTCRWWTCQGYWSYTVSLTGSAFGLQQRP